MVNHINRCQQVNFDQIEVLAWKSHNKSPELMCSSGDFRSVCCPFVMKGRGISKLTFTRTSLAHTFKRINHSFMLLPPTIANAILIMSIKQSKLTFEECCPAYGDTGGKNNEDTTPQPSLHVDRGELNQLISPASEVPLSLWSSRPSGCRCRTETAESASGPLRRSETHVTCRSCYRWGRMTVTLSWLLDWTTSLWFVHSALYFIKK